MTLRIRGSRGRMSGAFHDYLTRELKYMSQEPYYLSGPGVSQAWDFKHRASGGGQRGEQTAPDVAMDLSDAMRKNPRLKVFSANGYFDLATPFFATEYDLHHLVLPPKIASESFVWVLPGGAHGLSECGGAEADEGGPGPVLWGGAGALAALGFEVELGGFG